MDLTRTRIKHTDNEDIKHLFHSQEVYEMTSPRGRVLILHNDNFTKPANSDQVKLGYRTGSAVDRNQLKEVFQGLHFEVEVYDNASSQEMLCIIENETRNEKHGEYGMFVLIILSHGKENSVFGSDSQPVTYRDIYQKLCARNFQAMKGKPKWVIIQACAGNEQDQLQRDDASSQHSFTTIRDEPLLVTDLKTDVTDFFILQSSFPGYVSLRHVEDGTCLIQSLIKALRKHACHEHLQEIVVRVRIAVLQACEEYANKSGKSNLVQTVFSSESLLKKIYLFPGLTPDQARVVRPGQEQEQSRASRPHSLRSTGSEVSFDAVPTGNPLNQPQSLGAGDFAQPSLDIGMSPSFIFNHFSVEDHVIFAYSEAYKHYLTFTTGQAACFLDSTCANKLGFQIPTSGGMPKPLFMAGVITELQNCQAKKDGNRFNVKSGTKFSRVRAKKIALPSEFHDGDRVFLFKPKTGGPVYVVGEPPYKFFLDDECRTQMIRNEFSPGFFCQAQITEIRRRRGNPVDLTDKQEASYSVKCKQISLSEFCTVTLPPQTP